MKVIVSGRNVDITDALRDTVQSKLGKLDKFFNKELEAQATLSVQKNRHIIEVTIPINGSILRAEESTEDMYGSIDKAVDKLTRQLRKQKNKLENRNNKYETIRFENIPAYEESMQESKIVKTKRFAMKPMNAEEAILQMELLGHSFYVFADAETDDVNVIYKRKDGNYGLIEPDFE
ncbi:ribosome hibernation-promoting factor, HPF/YfiA family [Alkaliphilus sp. B6464]|uniref:ribosome hibernation-promoting factor, HPF/YfiA family n=1 Tax=Alkaliphilus sp. B6464 TaxID=2731219 RepID=UPI001BA4D8AF|nr:ribosome-associated translation inhibitor RaiA [Alkaliphilus sp. B6464]QUH18997.1 ribosome-associated translation inhibitor RaiA [Alkaliphilus sp. B6464]